MIRGYEDLDFTLRLIAAGYECFYVPDAIAYHERGQTFGSGRYTAAYARVKRRNWLLFLRRHAPLHQRLGFYLLGAPLRVARTSFRELRRGNLQAVVALLRIGKDSGKGSVSRDSPCHSGDTVLWTARAIGTPRRVTAAMDPHNNHSNRESYMEFH